MADPARRSRRRSGQNWLKSGQDCLTEAARRLLLHAFQLPRIRAAKPEHDVLRTIGAPSLPSVASADSAIRRFTSQERHHTL
jgi:hypothetical protein